MSFIIIVDDSAFRCWGFAIIWNWFNSTAFLNEGVCLIDCRPRCLLGTQLLKWQLGQQSILSCRSLFQVIIVLYHYWLPQILLFRAYEFTFLGRWWVVPTSWWHLRLKLFQNLFLLTRTFKLTYLLKFDAPSFFNLIRAGFWWSLRWLTKEITLQSKNLTDVIKVEHWLWILHLREFLFNYI